MNAYTREVIMKKYCLSLSQMQNVTLPPLRVGIFDNEINRLLDPNGDHICARAKLYALISTALRRKLIFQVLNGSSGGMMIGMLERKEIDVNFQEFAYNDERSEIVTFSYPVEINDGITILGRHSVDHSNHENLFNIFRLGVWITLIISLIVCASLTTILMNFKRNFFALLIDHFCIFLEMGTVINVKDRKQNRTIIISWIIGSMIVSFYLKNDIRAKFLSGKDVLIDSLNDLEATDVGIFVYQQSFQHRTLKPLIGSERLELIEWTDIWSQKVVRSIMKNTHVLVYESGRLDTILKFNNQFPLYLSRHNQDLRIRSFVMQKNVSKVFKKQIDNLAQLLTVSGLFYYLKANELYFYELLELQKTKNQTFYARVKAKNTVNSKLYVELGLSHLHDAFQHLLVGYAVSCSYFFCIFVINQLKICITSVLQLA